MINELFIHSHWTHCRFHSPLAHGISCTILGSNRQHILWSHSWTFLPESHWLCWVLQTVKGPWACLYFLAACHQPIIHHSKLSFSVAAVAMGCRSCCRRRRCCRCRLSRATAVFTQTQTEPGWATAKHTTPNCQLVLCLIPFYEFICCTGYRLQIDLSSLCFTSFIVSFFLYLFSPTLFLLLGMQWWTVLRPWILVSQLNVCLHGY